MSLIGSDDSHIDARTGWGIVFSEGESEDVKRALEPLIDHRRRQAGSGFRMLEPYVKGCAWLDWLGAHDAIPGVLDTTKIPYYVALVGGPEKIPYGFQYLMDVEFAVGRIAFADIDTANRVVHDEAVFVEIQHAAENEFLAGRMADKFAEEREAQRLAAL